MIAELPHKNPAMAREIYEVFQLSYAVEAELLGVADFPPLRRPLESFQQSDHTFFGYREGGAMAGIVEVEIYGEVVDINSLVVKPAFFRGGIGRKLMEFVLQHYQPERFRVETAAENLPAVKLYEKLGFREKRRWITDFGIEKVSLEREGK